jgi:Domain of unknown function (DUF6265)
MKKMVSCFVLAAAFAQTVVAQEKKTEHTLKLGVGRASPPATLADISWLAGHWTGNAFDGLCEEIWSPPRHGAMMGMFRLINHGKTTLYELMTLVEEQGSLILRLKHFGPKLNGWEEKAKTVDFKFVGKQDGAVHFEGLTFKPEGKPEGKTGVTIYLAVEQKGDKVEEEVIRYTRVAK